MASIDSYLDRACARLRANPAEVEDLRREIRAHLEDLIEQYCAEGMSRPEAAERAIAWLGKAEQIQTGLGAVFHGDPEWVRRLKGMAVGGLLGAVLPLLVPFAGHATTADATLGAASGVCIGLLSASRSRLVAGFAIGSLTWFAATVGSLAALAVSSTVPASSPLQLAHSVLFALVAGGAFGVLVAAGSALLLSLLSRSGSRLG
jgi:hypothetical protein